MKQYRNHMMIVMTNTGKLRSRKRVLLWAPHFGGFHIYYSLT